MKKQVFLLLLGIVSISLWGQVRVANIFTDNMVIQAHKPVTIWGTASAGEKIEVNVGKNKQKTQADEKGKWSVTFSPMDYGDEANVKVVGENNQIELLNAVVGEVWLCSGQSNMAMRVNADGGQVYNYKKEENNAKFPDIRSYNVQPNYSANTDVDIIGQWEVCSPETVSNFSAVAYFFAREIHSRTGLPIGIINSSWGGTDIETWISSDTFEKLPELFKVRYTQIAEIGLDSILRANEKNIKSFTELVTNDVGMEEKWYKPDTDLRSWKTMAIPQEWSTTDLSEFNGAAWFRYDLNISEKDVDQSAVISLGKIDDNDITWINGIKIGETEGAGHDRVYSIPIGTLKPGTNSLVIKVMDARGPGGFTGKPEDLYIETEGGIYTLSDHWLYQETVSCEDYHFIDGEPNLYYSLLYNAMIDPLKFYSIKGVIWYQGENNAGQAYNYRTLFPTLINDWRSKWKDNFPFYWAQLSAFMPKPESPPVFDHWAELREAQQLTLSLEHTGQAVTTDIGDANDIHPRNKQDVGKRLALIALNKDYGMQDIIYSGPTYKSMRIEGGKVIIEFDNVAQGLSVANKYGYIQGFSLSGIENKFVWAKAKLLGTNKVVVYSDQISAPIAVRYCWSMNPDVNLYNSAGLPASPFRTDNWKLSTQD